MNEYLYKHFVCILFLLETTVSKYICSFFVVYISIYSLVNQTMSDLDVGKVRQILSEALDVWSRGSRLTFQEVYSKDADIQILFARYENKPSSFLRY